VQNTNPGILANDPGSEHISMQPDVAGNHTLTSEQYEQLLALLSKQNWQVTPNVEASHSAYLAGKLYCLLSTQPKLSWIMDSGATDHITPHLHLFQSYTPVLHDCFITMPNGRQVQVKHIGTTLLNADIVLHNVLHVPDFHFNLLSANKLAQHLSYNVIFTPNSYYIQDPLKNKQMVFGREQGGLYLMNCAVEASSVSLPQQCLK